MSSQVEQARDWNLTRNLVAALGSPCPHQAAYVRHAVDAGSLCSIDSVSYDLAFTVIPDKFRCSAVSTRVSSLLLVKSDRWHPQYWCSNGDDENDVLGADSVGL